MTTTEFIINTRGMRYSGNGLAALKNSKLGTALKVHDACKDSPLTIKLIGTEPPDAATERVWVEKEQACRPPQPAKGRHIGKYALTTELAPWVKTALDNYRPSKQALELTRPFAAEFHDMINNERASSTGWHDIDAIELTYQSTLEICADIMLAADECVDPVQFAAQLHASNAGGDDHFLPWGRLLTGLKCDPPIVAQFPFYLLMCQSFTLEPDIVRENFVYSALTGVDWARGQNKFNDRIAAFERLARSSVPSLDDTEVHGDRCYWRLSLAYIRAMNDCENSRSFDAPRTAAIDHGLESDLVIFARALDTIGSSYMGRDGASFLDDQGMDSLIGCGLANDVMDLHTDIFTGETRNLIRLVYTSGYSMAQAMQTMSTVLSSMLCEILRGHHRARLGNREDGRISSSSPPYNFCRARHRRIFETLEVYSERYPQFWEWVWEIYHNAKAQVTAAALAEPLVCGLKRAVTQRALPESPRTTYFKAYWSMIEDGIDQAEMKSARPLGVPTALAFITREIHDLWHRQLLDANKAPGWGREFDRRSDKLFGEAGAILEAQGGGANEDAYRFCIAYGRLSMGLPYVAYHAVDAIIMVSGAVAPWEEVMKAP